MENLYKKEWQELIDEYRSSGLSALAWSQKKKVSVHKLRYWIRKLNKAELKNETSEQQWVSVQTCSTTIVPPVITVKIGNAEVLVSEGFNKELFTEVVHSLLSLC